jgi:hypothetical protein
MIGCGGGSRTRSYAAYEAAAFPPGSPAIFLKVARRLCSPVLQPPLFPSSSSVLPRARKVLETKLRKLAHAVL